MNDRPASKGPDMPEEPTKSHCPWAWLWDMHPLADDAWKNVEFAKDYWSDWVHAGQAIEVRRWVTGPNGPAFLTEYTPADDYVTEEYRGVHEFFNGLYQDADRRFYVPLPEDLAKVKGIFPHLQNPGNPSWRQVEAELVAAGRSRDELAKMNSPTLLLLLAQTRATAPPAESKPKGELPPRVAKVWDDFQYAIVRIKDKSPTDRQVYDWLLVHRRDDGTCVRFDTWRRYLRQARECYGCQKNTPRAGRPMGSSIGTESAADRINNEDD